MPAEFAREACLLVTATTPRGTLMMEMLMGVSYPAIFAAAAFVGSTGESTSWTQGVDGIGWETAVSNIESLSFSYYQGASAALPAPLLVSNLPPMVRKKDTAGSGPGLRHTVQPGFFEQARAHRTMNGRISLRVA